MNENSTITAPAASGSDAGLGTALDLQPFCSTDETRWSLMKPWNHAPFTYATDGRIMVRVPLRPECGTDRELPSYVVPAALNLFKNFPGLSDARWVPLPALPDAPEKIPCPDCNGSGAVMVTYPGGDNDAVVCDHCEGEKLVENFGRHRVGNREIAIHYAIKMARLPGLLVTLGRGEKWDPLAFMFNGGEGVLMPLKPSA